MSYTNLSKYISLILRHKPEEAGITLDSHGWADVKQLIAGINRKYRIDMSILEEIVKSDSKQRYSFNSDKTKIRANQGHSINVDVELKEVEPPSTLYHGTCTKFYDSISKQGIKPQSRLYVHLSSDEKTALNVGRRHGNPVVIVINSRLMYKNGIKFFKSENGVYLTKYVPPEYFEKFIYSK